MLAVRDLETAYGPSQVLFGVNLEVGTSQVVSLLGRNGMGKTTTVRSIMGIARPKAGHITFDGKAMNGLPSYRIAQAGLGLELEAVGAAVIGGVAIFGGSGTLWGAAFGAVLLFTINRALPVLGIPDFWQRAVVGVLIIGAIVLDRILALRQSRKLIEARDEDHG